MATLGEGEGLHDHVSQSCDCSHNAQHAPGVPTVFDVVKSGMLIPFQTYVENMGDECLKARDEKGNTVAHWVALGGQTTMLRYIIEMKGSIDDMSDNELGQHPIHWACVNGHIAVIEILLQAGVNVDTTDNKGCTPLIVACQYGKTVLAGYLLGRGASLHITDKDGDTPLHWASFKGYSELSRLLIYSGFNPHQRDNYNQTPLHLACISGDLICVKELCEQDEVELDIADKNGKTPLMLARGRKHHKIVEYLKKRARRKFLPRIDFRTIVFGPPGNTKLPLVFFVVNMICWAYPMYVLKCLPFTWNELETLHIFFLAINAVMWISLYHASTVDPGFLPRNVPEYDRAIKEVAHYDEWKQGSNPLNRLCHTCRTVKPLRSKHCRVCNRCVTMFDHHCPYIYNCVGYNNRASFVTFACCVMVSGFMSLYFQWYQYEEYRDLWYAPYATLETVFFQAVAVWVSTSTVLQIVVNLTTNERINRNRYGYLKDGKGNYYNPFSRGIVNNVMEFFYLKRAQSQDEVDLLNVHVV